MRAAVIAASAVLGLLAAGEPASAQLAGRSAQEWIPLLESPQRVQRLKTSETVAALKLRPGDVVVDVGAGTGLFEQDLSRAVGPTGKIYAVEIEQGLVDAIAGKVAQHGLANVTPVLGRFTDPALPARNVDLAFIYDVLHHIEDRPAYLKALAGYIKPSGRIALVDFIPEKSGHRNQPEMVIPRAQADALMAGAGFRPVEEIGLFEDNYYVVYARN